MPPPCLLPPCWGHARPLAPMGAVGPGRDFSSQDFPMLEDLLFPGLPGWAPTGLRDPSSFSYSSRAPHRHSPWMVVACSGDAGGHGSFLPRGGGWRKSEARRFGAEPNWRWGGGHSWSGCAEMSLTWSTGLCWGIQLGTLRAASAGLCACHRAVLASLLLYGVSTLGKVPWAQPELRAGARCQQDPHPSTTLPAPRQHWEEMLGLGKLCPPARQRRWEPWWPPAPFPPSSASFPPCAAAGWAANPLSLCFSHSSSTPTAARWAPQCYAPPRARTIRELLQHWDASSLCF